MAKLGKLNLEDEKISKLDIGAAGGIKLEEKMKQVAQKILAQTQVRIEKAKAHGKKAASTISGNLQKHGGKATAVILAAGMAASLAACTPTKTPAQEITSPPSQSNTQEAPKETPTHEAPGTEVPKETPTQEVPSTETPSQETPTQETPGAGLTVGEYIDSIMTGLNMDYLTAKMAKEYVEGLLRQIDELCVKYNCSTEDIEAHKKIAVEKYFDGVAAGTNQTAYEVWRDRRDTAQEESWGMHKELNR